MNKNTEYEMFVKSIYTTLNLEEGHDVDIKHNVKIKGKSGQEHQIDVYWEFQNLGVTHRVAIECKNYSNAVPIGKVRDFFGVLEDIGNITGMFVSKHGFQNGSKTFADYHGILLKEARAPKDEDFEGRIQKIIMQIVTFTPIITNTKLDLDLEWIAKTYPDIQRIECNDKLIIRDYEGNIKKTSDDFIKEISQNYLDREESSQTKGFIKTVEFDNDSYIFHENYKLKAKSIVFHYDVQKTENTSCIESLSNAILKDVKSGRVLFFDEYGNIRGDVER